MIQGGCCVVSTDFQYGGTCSQFYYYLLLGDKPISSNTPQKKIQLIMIDQGCGCF